MQKKVNIDVTCIWEIIDVNEVENKITKQFCASAFWFVAKVKVLTKFIEMTNALNMFCKFVTIVVL